MFTTGQKVIRFIETYCRVPEGAHVGKPLRLDPFQKDFLLAVYDNPAGTSTAYLSIARKNGKTGLIAAILLAHLVGPVARLNSQIISGAMSRDQAALVFKLAVKMIQLNRELAALVRVVPSVKTLIGLPMNVEYRAIAAEGKTAHGLSPVLAILDEIGQIRGPQDDFVDAITTAQGAHEDPLLIVISTQAASDADLFSLWLDDAEQSGDPHIVSHVYAAPEGAGVMDQEAWALANPALGTFRSLADLQRQAEKASRMPSSENTFRNLCLNQRVSTVSPFISRNVWQGCIGGYGIPPGAAVYGGLDLSARTDLTSLVLVAEVEGVWFVEAYFWTPEEGLDDRAKRDRQPYDVWVREGWLRTTPGATVDYEFVVAEMAEILSDHWVEEIAFDRWRIDVLRKEVSRIDLDFPLVEFGQGFKDMSPALDSLEAILLNGRLAHGMHPVLTMCAANAVVVKDPSGNRKLDKSKAVGRIDGTVALAMAIGIATRDLDAEGGSFADFLENPLIV